MNFFIANVFGDCYLASYAIVNLIITMSEVFNCVSDSFSGVVATGDGAKNSDDIHEILNYAKKRMVILCIIMSSIFVALSWLVPYVYGLTDGPQYKMSMIASIICGITISGYGLNIFLGGYYTALGKPIVSAFGQATFAFIYPLVFAISLGLIFSSFSIETGYIGFLAGFALAPAIGALTLILFARKLNKSKKIIVIPDYNDDQFSIDLYLNEENIIKTRDEIETKLLERNIERTTVNKVMVVVEDLLFIINNKNQNKLVTDRLTIAISNDKIRLLNKDNGKVTKVSNKKNKDKYILLNVVPTKNSFKNNLLFAFNSTTLSINR